MAYTTIDDPSAYFHTQLYTSDSGNTQSITNNANAGNFKPDFIWAKSRADIGGYEISHDLVDSSRGRAASLHSDTDGAETTASQTNYDLISFDTNGFTTGAPENTNSLGGGAVGKVAWQWKANGGTTASNTDGTITSTVQANQDAGFSIVTYTGNGTDGATVGHGLGAVPAMVLFKCRDTSNTDWRIYHQSISPTNALSLNSAGAQYGASGVFGGTFTSTLLKVENDTGANRNTSPMIAYCFAEKQGYSKFGKYVGNGNSNGPFVYTGFKPAFVLIKRTDSTGGWTIYDTKRGYNGNNYELFPHSNEAEYTGTLYFEADILSNGFKLRLTDGQINASGGSYIYMAFAENPFVTSTGIPTTAR